MKTKLNGILTLLLALVVQVAFSQQTVTGKVTGPDGDELIGAVVSVKGTSTFASTDFDGNYTIQATPEDTLVFTYVGYEAKEIVVGSQTLINMTLSTSLDAVIVRAYGTQTTKKNISSVSIVKSDAIEDVPANSPQELLQGQASGTQVVQSSGILGAAPVINIRGTGSLTSGVRPLFVIDGVPMSDVALTSGQGGQALNPLANINPNDIESFSVLKDAAATAIYGSRGSNGVVLITTKGGKKNSATRIRLDVSTGFSKSIDELQMLDADQFRQFAVDANYFGISDPALLPQGGFDWTDGVVREGTYENIDVSASGGSEKTSYFVSANVKNEVGFIIGNGLQRRATRINLNHEATDWLNIGANLSYSFSDNDRVGSENSTFAPLTSAYLMRPWNEPRDASGNFQNLGFIANVIAIETLDINRSTQSRLNGRLFATANIIDGLTFTSAFGMDRLNIEEQERSFEVNSPGGFATSFFGYDNRFIVTNTLDYNKTFAEKHDLNILVGSSYEEARGRNLRASGVGFSSDALINLRSAGTITSGGTFDNRNDLQGYFTRASYSYDDKYLLEGSVRRDGSSRFGTNNKFGTFWSAAAGWNISEENFMEDVSWVNNLKLRTSYGLVGNDRIGNAAFLPTFAPASYINQPSIVISNVGNLDLKWESTATLNVGIAGDLFNNRVRFAVDYYNSRTSDGILDVPTSWSISPGPNTAIRNVGEVENKGFDVSLAGDIFRDGDFKWTASLNMGINKNEVLALPGAGVDDLGRNFITGSASQRAIVGESVNTFFLVRYVGVNPQTGDAEWLDVDGNITTSPTASDRVVVGNANPDFVGGITNTFRYKGFDLNIISNFSVGNDIMLDGLRFTDNVGSGSFNNRLVTLDVWQNPGDNSFVPGFGSSTFATFNQRSTAQLKDGSFLRVKNVTLGYTFSKELLGKFDFIDSVRIYGTATNLLTFKSDELDGFDPEVTDTTAALGQGESFFTPGQSSSFIFGATFNF